MDIKGKVQISFLSELDASINRNWLFSDSDSYYNECGVLCGGLEFVVGDQRASVTINVRPYGDMVFYEYDYYAEGYGKGSPIDETSYRCHRNNSIDNFATFVYDELLNSELHNDKNLNDKSIKILSSLALKLKKTIMEKNK